MLLRTVKGLELVEMADCETCCGFGGTFAIKYRRYLQRHGREEMRSDRGGQDRSACSPAISVAS